VYTPQNFYRLSLLCDAITPINGVEEVLGLPNLKRIEKDSENKKFVITDIFDSIPENQDELDSILHLVQDQRFYAGQLFNEKNGANLILVTLSRDVLNSAKRLKVTDDILFLGNEYAEKTGIDLKYAGLPFVRSVVAGQIRDEMKIFLVLSVIISGLILLLFFRSWDAVVFPMIVIGVVVIWSMGTLALFGFKITLLTGLLPPIIVVIGIPNSIYLLNKYHQEIDKYGNKIRALSVMIRKIGIVTLLTNLTTAIGFGVLAFTRIIILREFGIVASILIMATFIVSIILIPAVFSYLPTPQGKRLKHLNFKLIDKFLTGVDLLVHRHKYSIFGTIIIIVTISLFGVYRVHSVSYMIDDIPEESQIKKDLAFFENSFSGIMPLEIVVDTGKKRGVINNQNLQKFEELETFLEEQEHISKPVSIVSFVKAARQAFYNNNPRFYGLPNRQDQNFILRYFRGESADNPLMKAFVDSTGQVMRISLKIADIGSNKMHDLIQDTIKPKLAAIFSGSGITAYPTGTTMLFVKGNNFLIENLRMSLLIAFVLISGIMALLFRYWKMILLSLIPNIIPILITAGLMGFAGIPFKPSTAITFSIAFGISVDFSIHFLAKYRQELFANNFFVTVAVTNSIREIGTSMVYTSMVLFAGFIIFAWSNFGGTIALGKLTSITLLIAMFTNLILLPALLLAFDDGKRKKDRHPLIENYDNFYQEDEDEEININLIKVENNPIKEENKNKVEIQDKYQNP
ncbi:MAG: MMPL family transporter, partial [Cyclobacteriaceae bacterium]|nr:MMPL family transporter [Cyclobacteriaceae bacterium]